MTGRLFIVGNGFDLHHGIASRYSDFASYLKKVDLDTFAVVEDYVIPEEDLWNELEERFAEIDPDQIESHAREFLVSYGADNWSDAYHHDYEYEIERISQTISLTMRRHFADWVRKLKIPSHIDVPVQCVDHSAIFLNFNYTPTLQRLYGVPDNRVLHIHGAASDTNNDIILGHGWRRQATDLRSRLTEEDTDVRVAGGFKLIDDLLAQTFKPTEQIINRNCAFFSNLSAVNEIFVLGHSLARVDSAYFDLVKNSVRPTADWNVSYYGDKEAVRVSAENVGIPASQLNLELLSNL